MATSLLDIRFIIERYTGGNLDNEWVIQVCNDARAEFSLDINIPDTAQISIDPSKMEYTLPNDLKIINRLRLQSDVDAGVDKDFVWPYRIYNGNIIFRRPWYANDTLNIDFYRNMKHFSSVEDEIDLDDRFAPLYTSYGQREYYDIPSVRDALGESQARREWEKHDSRYMNIRHQLTSY